MAQRMFKVTSAYVISLPDGTDACPGTHVVCDDKTTVGLVALGQLTPSQTTPPAPAVPAAKTAPSTRDAVAEHVPDKE